MCDEIDSLPKPWDKMKGVATVLSHNCGGVMFMGFVLTIFETVYTIHYLSTGPHNKKHK